MVSGLDYHKIRLFRSLRSLAMTDNGCCDSLRLIAMKYEGYLHLQRSLAMMDDGCFD